MATLAEYLRQLPDKGWGVLRAPGIAVLIMEGAGLIKVQLTAHTDVFQARLTGPGRAYLREKSR